MSIFMLQFNKKLSEFLFSSHYSTLITLILFSAILIDRDNTYQILIRNDEYFLVYEGNEFFKNFAGTAKWYILTLKNIILFSSIIITSHMSKSAKTRFAILLIVIHWHTSYLSWVLVAPTYLYAIPIICGLYFIYLWSCDRELGG